MIKACKKCGKPIDYFTLASGRTYGYCDDCYNKFEKPKEIEEKKRRKSLTENERNVGDEIKSLESGSGAVVLLVILGVIGLFFFLIPGIIFFVVAAIVSSSRKSRAASLRSQLELIKQSKKTKSLVTSNPLDILKKRF